MSVVTFAHHTALSEEDIDEYVRCYTAPGGMRAELYPYRIAVMAKAS